MDDLQAWVRSAQSQLEQIVHKTIVGKFALTYPELPLGNLNRGGFDWMHEVMLAYWRRVYNQSKPNN